MKLRCLFIVSLFCGLLWGCSASRGPAISNEKICHSWKSRLEDSNLTGDQIITFAANNEFKEQKKFVYSSSDSGFEFSIQCEVMTTGIWELRSDTIMLKYNDRVAVNPNPDSFYITPVTSVDSTLIAENIKTEMAKDMCAFLTNNIPKQFRSIANKFYPLGTIKVLTDDTLIIENNNSILKFIKFSH